MFALKRVKILTVQYKKKMTVSFFPFFAFYFVSGSSQPKNKSGIILIWEEKKTKMDFRHYTM